MTPDHDTALTTGVIEWHVAADHPAFAGHFPGRPIVPGVVLLDWALTAIEAGIGARLLPGRITAAKFLQPVLPGAALEIHWRRKAGGALQIDIRTGEHTVATCNWQGEAS